MAWITIRLRGELSDFVPRDRRDHALVVAYWRRSIKGLLESLGVPHPEIALIVANGAPVGWEYLPRPDDSIEVFPRAGEVPFPPLLPPPEPRFVVDTHLGKLAARLRLLGFDTRYRNDYDDSQLAQVAADERRVLLTRDLGLLKRSIVTHGCYVRATEPDQQVIEIRRHFEY